VAGAPSLTCSLRQGWDSTKSPKPRIHPHKVPLSRHLQQSLVGRDQRSAEMPRRGNQNAIRGIGVHLKRQAGAGDGNLRRERGQLHARFCQRLAYPLHHVGSKLQAPLLTTSPISHGVIALTASGFPSSPVQRLGGLRSQPGSLFHHPDKRVRVDK